MRDQLKAILRTVRLLDAARGLRDAGARLAWEVDRNLRRIDAELVAAHLRQAGERKLHIGCGDHLLDGWLNADYRPTSPRVLHLDATKPFERFEDDTFDYVFSEHMIEHVSYEEGLSMLSECQRVLRPRGKIRISTPNLSFLIDLYRDELTELQTRYLKWSAETYADVLVDDRTFVINNFVRDWGHRFIYDEKTLRRSLEQAGFQRIVGYELQRSDDAALRNLENEGRMPPAFLQLETFTLEATKVTERSAPSAPAR